MPILTELLPQLTQAQWLLHGLGFALNISLFLLAAPILNLVESGRDSDAKLRLFRFLNILVFLLHVVDLLILSANSEYENYFVKFALSLMAIYGALFFYSLCSYFSRKKFGLEKELDNTQVFLDTYSSRLVDIILLVIIVLSTILVLINMWGANSLLETTGIFGVIAAFLAFTSNIWAPDIISGLIILNTQILEDGDVVVIDGYSDEYVINKVSFIYIILYDVRNNHRTLMRNSRFIQSKIDNLSRVASTDGVRQALRYNIAYPEIAEGSREERAEALEHFLAKIDKLFERCYEAASEDTDIKINRKRNFEWSLTHTGNYALEFTLWIYLERIPNTKITAKIRKHLMGTIFRVNEEVFKASIIESLDLSTPDLAKISGAVHSSPAPSN
jgi:hypothetical protein